MSLSAVVDVFSDVFEFDDEENVFSDVFQFDGVPETIGISGIPLSLLGTSSRGIVLRGAGAFPLSAIGVSTNPIHLRGIRNAR
jgi:hypothetical protein